MLAAERHARIADMVTRHKTVTVSELCKQFAVSDMTIRRDLQRLEDEGVLMRTHGGAVAVLPEQDAAFGIREQAHPEAKEAIARVAASLVNPGDTIILDAGTTTARLARHLHGKVGLTVITTSLHVLRELGGDEQITLIATGGTVRPATLSFVGSWAEEMLSGFHADALFLAATSVDLSRGLFNSNVYEIGIKQQMIRSARRVVLLADHTKFGRQSTARIAGLEQVHCVVSDSQIAPDVALALREHGIEVRFASLHE
ncbi:MAG: DeoR/GlpR transcriptional regulator [Anaerolineae bacterium]|nr:DeoR/GlpR transcriptional regulator [Anaerolineae bacterium]